MHASRSNRSIVPGDRPRRRAVLHAAAFVLAALLVAACGAPGTGGTPSGSLTVAPTSLELGVGADATLTASLDGTPTTNVTWASGNASVASVDAAGVVTGVSAGSTSITASAGGATAAASVSVVACTSPTTVDDDVTVPTTWTAQGAGCTDYVVLNKISVTDTLTVEPGAVVHFAADAELRVTSGGSIVADGTSAAPILFTGSERVPGHWNGIIIWRTGEDPRSVFDHVTIEYAGGEPAAPDFDVYGYNLVLGSPTGDPSVMARQTTLTNTTLRHSAGYGLYISYQSTFVPNGFANNTLTENALGAAHVSAQAARWLDAATSYAGNGAELVFLDATNTARDIVEDDATWPALGDGVRYLVDGVIDLRAVLTLEPGATLSFSQDTGLFAQNENAGIVADGTSANPIVLTGEVEVGGSWYGVYLRQARTSGNVMDHVTIEYGGGAYAGGVTGWVTNVDHQFNLSIGQNPQNEVAQMDVTNSTFRHAGVVGSGLGYGIYVSSGSDPNPGICSTAGNVFEASNEQGCFIDPD